jgi:DNA-binding PadR family transcriptional regulator
MVMSKANVIRYFKYYPVKVRGFTVQEIARFNQVSSISIYITIRRLRQSGFIKILRDSKGRGRGNGKSRAVYYFTSNGLIWLRRNNVFV